jgi:sensor histidine kinase YesM
MFLGSVDLFLLGAFFIIFIYGFTQYLFLKDETYYLYFTLGSLISIIRMISVNIETNYSSEQFNHMLIANINCLTFIWGPYLYFRLAESLFPKVSIPKISKGLFFIGLGVSFLIVVLFVPFFPNQFIYDYIILCSIAYASYVFIVATIKKLEFSSILLIAHCIFLGGMIHDILLGSQIISSPWGEINSMAYLLFMIIALIVIGHKQKKINEAYLNTHINFLHAQINPHFLYNTINTIRACCVTDGKKSSELLSLLSTYLRGKLTNNDPKLIPLSDEIELIKAYLDIQQYRYEERLTVTYDIDEACDILIPCLTIQPIVENAVSHGLAPKVEGGKLHISIQKIHEGIRISIQDNGIGIDKRQLNDLLKNKSSGIGLRNSNERLKQYYGTQLEISSHIGTGTIVSLTIPTHRKILLKG